MTATTATTATATTTATTKAARSTKAKAEATKAKQEMSTFEQYKALKAKHPEAVLLFREGDFYVTYEADAETTSKVLGITITRKNTEGKSVKMSMFPCHAIDNCLPRFIRAGHKVAICDGPTNPPKEVVEPSPTITEETIEFKQETPEEAAARKTRELQTTLQKLAQLQDLNQKRSKFIETLDQLNTAKDLLSQQTDICAEDIFYSIDFAGGQTKYNREKLFSITNTEIVLDFVNYLTEKIKAKVEELEAQIIAV